MEQKPCEVPCPKCGNNDIYRHFFHKGSDTNGRILKRNVPSSKFVDRSGEYYQPALADCLVNHCRCCQFEWDTSPIAGDVDEAKAELLKHCFACGGKGVVRKYFDAGDHFGGSRAPGSGWEDVPCECCHGKK